MDDPPRARPARTATRWSPRCAGSCPDWEFEVPRGGLTLWVRTGGLSGSRLAEVGERVGVRVPSGPRFGVDGAFEGYRAAAVHGRRPVADEAAARLAAAARLVETGASRGDGGAAHVRRLGTEAWRRPVRPGGRSPSALPSPRPARAALPGSGRFATAGGDRLQTPPVGRRAGPGLRAVGRRSGRAAGRAPPCGAPRSSRRRRGRAWPAPGARRTGPVPRRA